MKIFNLSKLGIEPRSLDLQTNTLLHRFKSPFPLQGSTCVFIYSPTMWHSSPPIWNSFLNFLVQDAKGDKGGYLCTEWSLDGLFTVGAIVVEQKFLTCSSQKSNRQTLYHVAVKACFYRKGEEVYSYIPRPCDITKYM